MRQPLADVRVLELATGVSGPASGRLLADFGADVVKVEPIGGDESRRESPRPGPRPDPEASPLFLHLNANKRSVVAESTSDIEALVAWADVVVESDGSGSLGAHGLDTAAVRAAHPGLVVVSVTPFGLTGPWAGRSASELTTYALAGPMWATGHPDHEPVKLAGNVVHAQVGNVAALAALAAHRVAATSGHGSHVDVSQFEVQSASIDRRLAYLAGYRYTGRVAVREGGDRLGLIPAGFFPTADGHCQVVVAPNWMADRLAPLLGDDELTELLGRPDWMDDDDLPELVHTALMTWTLQRTKQAAMEEAQAGLLPITPLNSTTDVLGDPHFRRRRFWVDVDHPVVGRYERPGPQFRMRDAWAHRHPAPTLGEHTAAVASVTPRVRPTASPEPPRPPLDGIRVLDMTVVWAGPLCTMLLGDLGAEVIRLDNPNLFPTATRGAIPRPPPGRESDLGQVWGSFPGDRAGERPWNQVAAFTPHARNKLGLTLDLRRPLGRDAFLRLVDHSDLFVENNSARVLDGLDLGWDVLHERNPRLTLLRMPSLGLSGPYTDYIGFGAHMEALTGLSSLRGYPDLDASALDATYFMDPASGATAAFAALCALRRRDETGEGELIEFTQAENLIGMIGEYLVDASLTGTAHERHGNRHPHRAPQGVYRCAGDDRWVAVSVADDDEWRGLTAAMGSPAWAADAALATEEGRRARHDEIDTGVGAWTATRTREEVADACRAHGVTVGEVWDEADLCGSPQHAARGFFRANSSADVPPTELAGHHWRWDGPALRFGPLNTMGGDSRDVLRRVAGYTDTELDALEADGHLGLDYR